VCFACAKAQAKHTKTCLKGLFAAQPQGIRGIALTVSICGIIVHAYEECLLPSDRQIPLFSSDVLKPLDPGQRPRHRFVAYSPWWPHQSARSTLYE